MEEGTQNQLVVAVPPRVKQGRKHPGVGKLVADHSKQTEQGQWRDITSQICQPGVKSQAAECFYIIF